MSLLDVSIVNVAIPSMQSGLGASPGAIQWVVSGYALSFGLMLVAGGRLGDAFGRRRLMLIGLTGFVLASAAVGLSPTVELVVAARLLQGVAAGLLTPQNSGIIQQLFSGAERGRAFGLFGFTVSLASAIGPVLGGGIIAVAGEEQGWRWLFLVNVPVGVVALLAVARMVPRRPRDDDAADTRIDFVGALLLGLSVLCLLFPVVSLESGQRGPLLLLVGLPLAAWGFVRWERRQERLHRPPLLDLRLLRRLEGYPSGLAIGTLYFTGFTGILLVVSVFLQESLGYSALATGLVLMPFAVGSATSSPIAGRFVTGVGRRITVVALATMITGVLVVALVTPLVERSWTVLVPALLLTGLGGGAVVSPNITLTLAEVPPRMGGAAGGALQTGQRLGSAVGAALVLTAYGLAASATSAPLAFRTSLLVALVPLVAALALAVRVWRMDPTARQPKSPRSAK
ncbi:MFS transporter [Nocardioides sp. CBS4Y-1]|uniref:MFS transporter n=2 Tax=Nocardioides acrostichi TaxID=2784339 RepID=A0A930V0A2_9ACTN|nr:MFS transporter [Nocardioides acrostichi]